MDSVSNTQRLRRDQTADEEQLWRALHGGRFAGFEFRRQHPVGNYVLDFYCPLARLSVELDGFQHGLPNQAVQDQARTCFLADQNIAEMRFWNNQWRNDPDGVMLEICRLFKGEAAVSRWSAKQKTGDLFRRTSIK